MLVRSLHTYPVKGASGIAHESVEFAPAGLADDRRWMIVDAKGMFVSQRQVPQLALLGVSSAREGIKLRVPGLEDFLVRRPEGTERLTVTIWGDVVEAALADSEANAALSRWLSRDLRLVFYDDRAHRAVSRDWVDRETPVAFADGFPLLVTSEASLGEMNRQLAEKGLEPVPMDRFRPNIVIRDAEPFAEDGWASIAIGDAVFDLVKPCSRCVVTTIDQRSGTRTGREPLATLAQTHRSGDARAPGALFGWNVVPRGSGQLQVGDAVEIVAYRTTSWPIA